MLLPMEPAGTAGWKPGAPKPLLNSRSNEMSARISPDGKWLAYYGRSEEVVMVVPYRIAGSTFVAEKPRVWMRIGPGVSWLDPHADGTRAAVIRTEDPRRESLVLITNFFDHLRRLAGS